MGPDVDANLAIRRSAQIAGADHFTLFDEDDGVAGNFDFAEQVRVEEDGGASGTLFADDVTDKPAAHGIEAGSGLVQKDEFWLVDESLCETDALQHAFGKAAKTSVTMRREADEVEIRGHTVVELRQREAAEPPMKREKLGGGQPVVEAEVFREKTNFAANLYAREGETENFGFAARGFHEAEQHLDGRTFASTIRAEESKYFPATDLQGKTAHGDLRAENLAKAFSIDGQVVGGWQRSLRKLLERTG
jgi:hypothetical protein